MRENKLSEFSISNRGCAVSTVWQFSKLLGADSEKIENTSADQRCFRADQLWFCRNHIVQRWGKRIEKLTKRLGYIREDIMVTKKKSQWIRVFKFLKELSSDSFRQNSSCCNNFFFTTPWLHVTWITEKQMKYRVFNKKWTDKVEKSCEWDCFF